MSEHGNFTPNQQNVIDFRGKNMLVSASAGTGKTTVMIERIVSMIQHGVDVSDLVVVTFTNLAAAEMKSRLALKLSEKTDDPRIAEQLEQLDNAAICTLHSFCSDLLRNYFYVVDLDPSFSVLDDMTVATLRANALDDVFAQYFGKKDDEFRRVYKIFSSHRQEDNFRNTLLKLYDFSRCLDDFDGWYASRRAEFANITPDGGIYKTILSDIAQSVNYYLRNLDGLYNRADEENLAYKDVFAKTANNLRQIDLTDLQNAVNGIVTAAWEGLPRKSSKVTLGEIESNIRQNYRDMRKEWTDYVNKYADLCRGRQLDEMFAETASALRYTDKLAEIIGEFDKAFFAAKKQRGGVDFNDLEHLALQLLRDEATLRDIKSRYKWIFVDEYQDTNPVQEAIVSALADKDNLFMVGDVKQSIYGFRGCEPSIFVDKYNVYKTSADGQLEELNDNFRSNKHILDFVNAVFNLIMTPEFGKVDYKRAQLQGNAQPVLKGASVTVDLVLAAENEESEISEIYDIAADTQGQSGVKQCDVVAQRIRKYVGMKYRDKNGEMHSIGYGDIVILMRSLTQRAVDIYNALVAANIPVVANFKAEGYSAKEVRDLLSLLRVIDNPYNDIYMVGACLSPFGGMTESDLGVVRLDTAGRVSFYERLQAYSQSGVFNDLSRKITAFLTLVEQMRFYSRSASVCELIMKIFAQTQYPLYVESLPNGGIRLGKLYAFTDSIKDAPYAQSVDKFLSFVDETDNKRADDGLSRTGAVRLMTMHAAKGLEFPVVIVAGTEMRFRFDTEAVEKNTQLGIAARYYDFAAMQVSDTLGYFACQLQNRTKQREEEMRLLYVALTRAKYALNIIGTVTDKRLHGVGKLPSRAMSHLDWLLLAVNGNGDAGAVSDDNWEINVIQSADVNAEQTDGGEDLLCEQETDIAETDAKLNYRYPFANQTQMPSKVVSSALDKEYLDVTDEPQETPAINSDADSAFVGTAYHKVYQYVDYNATVEQIADTLNGLVNDGKIDRSVADRVDVNLIYATLRNADMQALLQSGKAYREVPFMLYVPYSQVAKDKRFDDEVMLQGVIDVLVLGKDRAAVIDFKYTSADSATIEERYAAQLNSYKLAVQRICGVSDVKCYVLSVADNKLIPM